MSLSNLIPCGIYTLANDTVYDQTVALLNSIEANVSPELPVCIIPFNDRCDRLIAEIDRRNNVTLFDNQVALTRWENFATQVWAAHPDHANRHWKKPQWGLGHHRKYVAFDGQFEKFVFYDADSLAMKPLNELFQKLDDFDFIFDDWEHRKNLDVSALDVRQIIKKDQYSEVEISRKLHCSSFFGSKQGLFSESFLAEAQRRLIEDNEIIWLRRWWDDAFLFNYLTFLKNCATFNYTQSPNPQDCTGNCADSDPFININGVLYNAQGYKPIHRLHYMNYSSVLFTRLCRGEDVQIRYRDEFLDYRFRHAPQERPAKLVPPGKRVRLQRRFQKAIQKVKKFF